LKFVADTISTFEIGDEGDGLELSLFGGIVLCCLNCDREIRTQLMVKLFENKNFIKKRNSVCFLFVICCMFERLCSHFSSKVQVIWNEEGELCESGVIDMRTELCFKEGLPGEVDELKELMKDEKEVLICNKNEVGEPMKENMIYLLKKMFGQYLKPELKPKDGEKMKIVCGRVMRNILYHSSGVKYDQSNSNEEKLFAMNTFGDEISRRGCGMWSDAKKEYLLGRVFEDDEFGEQCLIIVVEETNKMYLGWNQEEGNEKEKWIKEAESIRDEFLIGLLFIDKRFRLREGMIEMILNCLEEEYPHENFGFHFSKQKRIEKSKSYEKWKNLTTFIS
jgi:hypothetical protein